MYIQRVLLVSKMFKFSFLELKLLTYCLGPIDLFYTFGRSSSLA